MPASMESLPLGGHEKFAEEIFGKVKDLGYVKVIQLSQAEYDELSTAEKQNPQKLYLIDDNTEYETTSHASSTYLSKTDASSTYETKSHASETYSTLEDVSSYKQVSGSIASFSDGSALPMHSLKAYIEPVQSGSGDPSPTNVRPISGWTACNVNKAKAYQLCISEDSSSVTENGLTMTYEGNGKYRVKGSLSTNTTTRLFLPIESFDVYNGTDSYIKFNNTFGNSNFYIIFLKDSTQVDSWNIGNVNRESTFSGMRGKNINKVGVEIKNGLYGTSLDFTFKVEILSNSTTNLSTYTIQFTDGSNPLTVYSGYVDIVSGLLIVDGILETIDPSKFGGTSGGRLGWIDFNDSYVESLQNNNVMCNKLGDMVGSSTGWTSTTPCIAFRADPHTFRLYGNSALFSSGGAYENTTIYYKLNTPFSIQLTPTQVKSLLGENRVWADTGDAELEYQPQNVIAELRAEILNLQDTIAGGSSTTD